MLRKVQYDRINNNTKIMCLKKDKTFFWRLVYIHLRVCSLRKSTSTLNQINARVFGLHGR